MTSQLRQPVLLLAFNRPDTFARVIDAVREARPSRVYVAIDGPRPGVPDDVGSVQSCRDLVGAIDWTPHVHTLFRAGNLGCGRGVSSAITWFFEAEESGVVLEDDVVPRPAFFPFQDALLDRYADDPGVFSVAGSTFVPANRISVPATYRFSRYPYVWGWGTWRRAWAHYRFLLDDWRAQLPIDVLRERVGGSARALAYWTQRFDQQATTAVDTWDFQLAYTALRMGALTAVSNVNLTDNIGFDERSTHTRRRPHFGVPDVGTVDRPTGSPSLEPDPRADTWSLRNQLGATYPRLIYRSIRDRWVH
jgi:hypothetical protein